MTLCNRLAPLSLRFTFQKVSSLGRVSLSKCLGGKIPATTSELHCKGFSSVNFDSWGASKNYICGYQDIEELESAPEEVKRIFSLQNANRAELRKVAVKEITKDFEDKIERRVAALTVKIEAVKKNNEGRSGKKDHHNRVFLDWLMKQRMKKLAYLRNYRFERYLVVLKALGIPVLESTFSPKNKYKGRRTKIAVGSKKKKKKKKKKRNFLSGG